MLALGVAATVAICLAVADLYGRQHATNMHLCQVTQILWEHQQYINHKLGLPPQRPLPRCPNF